MDLNSNLLSETKPNLKGYTWYDLHFNSTVEITKLSDGATSGHHGQGGEECDHRG